MNHGILLLLSLLASVTTTRVEALAAAKAAKSKARSVGGTGFGAAKQVLTHTPDTSQTTQALVSFLKANKARGLGDVEIGFSPNTGVRGLYCTKNFSNGKIMCQIPSDCALALSDPSKNGQDAPTLAHGGANFLEMYWNNAQARKLWAPYLDTLPTQGSAQFDPTPDFFNDDELELLEFPRIIRQAKDRKQEIQTLAAEKGLDQQELQFATWLTASRAFCTSISSAPAADETTQYDERGQVITQVGEKKSLRVMVPFIDMANHSSDQPNARLTLIDPEKDEAWFALEATRPTAAGKEIVIAYGSEIESSVELLLNYGFVPNTNKIDEFMLKKGGKECITNLQGWTTSLEEDMAMLAMAQDNPILQKILRFRVRLKQSYPKE